MSPFVILKRILAVFAALFGITMILAMMFGDKTGQASENNQIVAFTIGSIPIAVGAWLWGGKDA